MGQGEVAGKVYGEVGLRRFLYGQKRDQFIDIPQTHAAPHTTVKTTSVKMFLLINIPPKERCNSCDWKGVQYITIHQSIYLFGS